MLPPMMTGPQTHRNRRTAAVAARRDLRTLIMAGSLGLIGILLLMGHSGVSG